MAWREIEAGSKGPFERSYQLDDDWGADQMKIQFAAVLLLWMSAIMPAASAQENQAAPASDATPIDVDAVQIPWARPDIQVSHRDRLYVALLGSGGFCAIDPAANDILGCSPSGEGGAAPQSADPIEAHLTATRRGDLIATSTTDLPKVAITATATNKLIGNVLLATVPASLAFTRDGKELWVALPEENAVAVFETRTFAEVARVAVSAGPAAIVMSVDGRRAFVSTSDGQGLAAIDARRKVEISRAATAGGLVKRLALTPNGKFVWAFDEAGRIEVFATKPPFKVKRSFYAAGGVRSLTFVHVGNDPFAYISSTEEPTIGVFDADSFRKVGSVTLEAEAAGVYPSGDGTIVYASLPSARKLVRLDTGQVGVVSELALPEGPSALIYVPSIHKRRVAGAH
ncbi:YncE family protein [Sphingomonas sp. S2-65]|uniref:YncE family protein n=1 Tax=Sphingomonas sp. S2-65 TaxID=2903960 RepID=UPI001F3974AF|nr:YncE family protein [Sphingomonas sp. S2-65]UYY58104.1 YncE family protein [Sphingomonas sp. S2-65]